MNMLEHIYTGYVAKENALNNRRTRIKKSTETVFLIAINDSSKCICVDQNLQNTTCLIVIDLINLRQAIM